jgi:hypothetical protein
MKKVLQRPIIATGIYAAFVVAHACMEQGAPGRIIPVVIASVIYISLMSVFLRRQQA